MDPARKVTQLMRMEEATREAYDAAMGKLPGSKIHPSLARFRKTHQEHVEGLRQLAEEIGGQPVGDEIFNKYRDEVIDAVRQTKDFEGVFSTLRAVEAAIALQYDDAMESDLPEQAHARVRTYLKDEREMPDLLNVATHGLAET